MNSTRMLTGLLAVGAALTAGAHMWEDRDAIDFHPGNNEKYNGGRYLGASADWISLRLDGFSTEEMPSTYNKGKKNIIVRHEVPPFPFGSKPGDKFPLRLTGDLTVRIRKWDGTDERIVGVQAVTNWEYRQEKRFRFDFGTLEPSGYIVTAELPPMIWAGPAFNPKNTGSGSFGVQQITGKNVMRIGVFKEPGPEGIFGVGNMMAHHDWAYPGYKIKDILEIKQALDPVAVLIGDPFHNAIAGVYSHEGWWIDWGVPNKDPEMTNPMAKGMLDVYSPKGRAELKRRAELSGKRLSKRVGVFAANINGEGNHLNRGSVCPTKWADLSFREFCRKRYGDDLAKANKVWQKSYKSWDDVRQPIYVDGEISRDKEKESGEKNTDWYSNSGRVGRDLVKCLNRPENVELGMDWYRWRSWSTFDVETKFVEEAHKFDRRTKYITCYCWPTFFQHLVTPIVRRMDGCALDAQYLCSVMPRTPGSDDQMLDGLEMTESILKGKPLYAFETYVQPDYPEDMVALQNWALVAHGVSVNLLECWKPYADRGQSVFKNGPRAWTRPEGNCMMLFCVDTDGTRLPAFYGLQRSTQEIKKFHERHNGNSLKRIRGRTAYYLSDETSMYIMLKTGDMPYDDSHLCESRNHISSALRLGGARIEYLDDETVQTELRKKDYDVVVLPPTPRMIPEAAAALARFEKEGGKVIRMEEKREKGWEKALFAAHPEIARNAWWDDGAGKMNVEVVVRRQEKTGKRFVFVLNRRDLAGKGTLKGTDFTADTKFSDAMTGEKCGVTFDLPGYGYKILIQE